MIMMAGGRTRADVIMGIWLGSSDQNLTIVGEVNASAALAWRAVL
jgi:hypothetical protein